MKTSFIILSLLVSNLLATNELSWVDEQVQAIKPPRDGMSRSALSKIQDPFIFLKKNRGEEDEEKKKELKQNQIATVVQPQKPGTRAIVTPSAKREKKGLTLDAILNKSAMINGNWYKLRANVHGYIVSDITRNSVLLTKNKKSLLLTTKTLNTKIKFQK